MQYRLVKKRYVIQNTGLQSDGRCPSVGEDRGIMTRTIHGGLNGLDIIAYMVDFILVV